MQIFVASLAMKQSAFQEIDHDDAWTGEKIYHYNVVHEICNFGAKVIDLSRIPTNNGTESRLGWTKMQQMYENVHPSLALVLLFVRTEVECGKGLLWNLFNK